MKIGDYAFLKCTSLIDISIASSNTEIGIDVFLGCSSLKKNFGKDEQFANLDDYKIIEIIQKGSDVNIYKATDNKTGQVVELTEYKSSISQNLLLLRRLVAVSRIGIPGIIKILNYSFPLINEEKSDEKIKSLPFDLNNGFTISKYMKNGRLDIITKKYLKDPKTV